MKDRQNFEFCCLIILITCNWVVSIDKNNALGFKTMSKIIMEWALFSGTIAHTFHVVLKKKQKIRTKTRAKHNIKKCMYTFFPSFSLSRKRWANITIFPFVITFQFYFRLLANSQWLHNILELFTYLHVRAFAGNNKFSLSRSLCFYLHLCVSHIDESHILSIWINTLTTRVEKRGEKKYVEKTVREI